MTRRGEPLPINQALNRPRAKLGLDLTAWMAIVFVCVTVFLVGFRLVAMIAFPTLVAGAWLIVRKHERSQSRPHHVSGVKQAFFAEEFSQPSARLNLTA